MSVLPSPVVGNLFDVTLSMGVVPGLMGVCRLGISSGASQTQGTLGIRLDSNDWVILAGTYRVGRYEAFPLGTSICVLSVRYQPTGQVVPRGWLSAMVRAYRPVQGRVVRRLRWSGGLIPLRFSTADLCVDSIVSSPNSDGFALAITQQAIRAEPSDHGLLWFHSC